MGSEGQQQQPPSTVRSVYTVLYSLQPPGAWSPACRRQQAYRNFMKPLFVPVIRGSVTGRPPRHRPAAAMMEAVGGEARELCQLLLAGVRD